MPLAVLLAAALSLSAPPPEPPRVVITTTAGPVTVELDPVHAPAAVARFLARAGLAPAPAGVGPLASYAGTELCESRARALLVFGCLPFDRTTPERPHAAPEPPQPDEIDAAAMGLGAEVLTDTREIHALWQREVVPRYVTLREARRPVPPALEALVDAVRREGPDAEPRLRGRTRQQYLEALGYAFTPGGAPSRVTRGALATANTLPGEADARFLLVVEDVPERDGRATVFGRVVAGWDVLGALAAAPVDRMRRPVQPVRIERIALVAPAAPERDGEP